MPRSKCSYCHKELESEHQLYSHYAQQPCAKYRERYIRQLGEEAYQNHKAVPLRRTASIARPSTVRRNLTGGLSWKELTMEVRPVRMYRQGPRIGRRWK